MKYIGFIFIGFILGIYITLNATAPRPPSTIQINVINNSNMNVSNITIKHNDGKVILNKLEKNSSQAISVMIFPESSYSIQVSLENGNILNGGIAYIESNYITQEVITNTSIKSSYLSTF